MSESENISLNDARDLMYRAFLAAGASDTNAKSVATALVAAEAEGQIGHGFSRLSDYVAQAKTGKVKADATPRAEQLATTSWRIDAGNGFAYPAMELALSHLIPTAEEHGTGMVSVIRSHHCGALSVQVEKIAQAGLIGIMMANTPLAIAPWGGTKPVFGTNPIAFAVPREDRTPLVIDLSLSKVARGKIMHAKKSGNPIPEGWAFDSKGQPTTDPEQALAGTMAPIGGAKGTSLALMVEILAATLGGANASASVSSFFTADGPPPGSGQFLMAIKPADSAGFAQRLEPLLNEIAEQEGARLPGERRAAALAKSEQDGLNVSKAFLNLARELATHAA